MANGYHPPILRGKSHDHDSLFVPENLLREARRQKNIPEGQIPPICVLDPDGDIVKNLIAANRAKVNPYWACYHTQLYNFEHNLPPSDYSHIADDLSAMCEGAFSKLSTPVYRGATWTTDAPFRETSVAIEQAKTEGILAVEMEAAALYAFAQARRKAVICFAHVTNQMGHIEGDFEKGEANGSKDALALIAATAEEWLSRKEG